jgi:hypothetical protein
MVFAAENKHKEIAEYVGRLNTATEALSIAHKKSPAGWIEPGQIAEFDEYTVVLRGTLHVETRAETIDVTAVRQSWLAWVNGWATAPWRPNSYVVTNYGSHTSRQITPDPGIGETHTTTVRASE